MFRKQASCTHITLSDKPLSRVISRWISPSLSSLYPLTMHWYGWKSSLLSLPPRISGQPQLFFQSWHLYAHWTPDFYLSNSKGYSSILLRFLILQWSMMALTLHWSWVWHVGMNILLPSPMAKGRKVFPTTQTSVCKEIQTSIKLLHGPPGFSYPEAGRRRWVGDSRRYFWALFRESCQDVSSIFLLNVWVFHTHCHQHGGIS